MHCLPNYHTGLKTLQANLDRICNPFIIICTPLNRASSFFFCHIYFAYFIIKPTEKSCYSLKWTVEDEIISNESNNFLFRFKVNVR